MKKLLAILLTLVLLAGFALPAVATTFPSFSTLCAMLRQANLVIVGTVTGYEEIRVYNLLAVSCDGTPHTLTSIQVTEVLRGNAQVGDTIQEIRPNHRSQTWDSEFGLIEWPDIWLEVGQTYLLFLFAFGDEIPMKINPWQGFYVVDSAGNLTGHPSNPVTIPSLDVLRSWRVCLPNWLQFILRWVFFGWIWM